MVKFIMAAAKRVAPLRFPRVKVTLTCFNFGRIFRILTPSPIMEMIPALRKLILLRD
jgi:hypothetical protein